jgi:hypothetical protein
MCKSGNKFEMTTASFETRQTEIRRDWQLAIDVDMVLQRQGANPGKVRSRQPRLVALAERAIAEGKPSIRPGVAYRILRIQEVKPGLVILKNGAELRGIGVARKLSGAEFVIGLVATVGEEIEQQILRATKEEATFALALDGYATAAVGALIIEARRYLAELVERKKLKTTTPLYPGTNDWELAAAQTQLFALVDAASIGVRLNPSYLMMPCKSVSMVIGVGTKTHPSAEPCEECGASASCRHRPSKM